MNEPASCPTVEELTSLSHGDLPGGSFEAISRHLEWCTQCQARLSDLEVPPDDFTRSLSQLDVLDLEHAAQKMDSESHRDSQIRLRNFLESARNRSQVIAPTLKTPCRLGPYDVLRKIGHGGMGEVYEARHIRLDRPVALKVIRGNRQDDPAAHARFLQEMSTTGKFDHPNLVRAYDAWEADGCLYLVLELLEGHSLQKLADDGRLDSAEEVRQIMLDLCRALEHLHASGLVHRDIKPSNVMRLRNGNIKLIDYGLTIDQISDPGTSVKLEGTVGYMAPEQAMPGRPIDARCDIYSAGKLLQYLMRKLTGLSQVQQSSEPVCNLEAIAARMTQPDPVERYPQVSEVIHDLNGAPPPTASNRDNSSYFGLTVWALIISIGTVTFAWRFHSGGNRDGSLASPESTKDTVKLEPKVRHKYPIVMVEVPAGSYLMGASSDDQERRPNESPQRQVNFAKPFRMSATEITVGQFREFVRSTGYRTDAERNPKGGWKASTATSWGQRSPNYVWSSPGYPVDDTLPITIVTYADATAFCEWLSDREGKIFRLPTEAEWEYACRAGTTTPTPYSPESRDDFCWTWYNVQNSASPMPVSTRNPNSWGLYDMCGNVREWCLDWYSTEAYSTPIEKNPNGPKVGTMRVVRGSCFMDSKEFLRSSHRVYVDPTQTLNNQGFRVVCEY